MRTADEGISLTVWMLCDNFASLHVGDPSNEDNIDQGSLPSAWRFGDFLNTVDKQIYYMALQGSTVLVNLGLNITFVKTELGISEIALRTAITYVM